MQQWDLTASEFPRQLSYPRGIILNILKNLYVRGKGVIPESRSCVNFIAVNQEEGRNHGEKEQYIPGRTVNHAE